MIGDSRTLHANLPEWLDPVPWVARCGAATEADVGAALADPQPAEAALAALLSPAGGRSLEAVAQRARALTRTHFGNTISLYAPLYLSNYCSGGCSYCGFAADRDQPRQRLEPAQIEAELRALKRMGFDDVLLLTGERCPEADFAYVRQSVACAAKTFSHVGVEAFAMDTDEYRDLAAAGCSSVTIYQETYDPVRYHDLHRWGPKRDYTFRLDAPARILEAGMRSVGVGVLLGLRDPRHDVMALYRHVRHLQKTFWQSGVSISFPRICSQRGDFHSPHPVSDRMLAQIICACRISLPDVPLVLSTREDPRFRDGMGGVGISKMSAASKTTVGGYTATAGTGGQFSVHDDRDVESFRAALQAKGLEPVFKSWDSVFCGQVN